MKSKASPQMKPLESRTPSAGTIPFRTMQGPPAPLFSVVIPTYNEAENIGSLLAEIGDHLRRAAISY